MSVSARRMKRTSITKKAPGRVAPFRIAAGQATTVVGAGGIDWVAETNYVSGGTAAMTTHIVSMNGVANPARYLFTKTNDGEFLPIPYMDLLLASSML